MSTVAGARRGVAIAIAWILTGVAPAPGAAPGPPSDQAVNAGVKYLKQHSSNLPAGEMALSALALLKSGLTPADPVVAEFLNTLQKRFDSEGYHPDRSGGADVYEAAVVAMALGNLEPEARRGKIEAVARYLVGKQKPNGSWDYDTRTFGDTSISQYAVLGLWEASNAGADVSASVFDRASSWFLSSQGQDGGWCYHRDELQEQTVSMTAAGVGSLLICARQLAEFRENARGDSPSRLLNALTAGGPRAVHEVETPQARIDRAVKQGFTWLAGHFTTASDPVIGHSIYYALYGIERIGALADRASIGRVDWYDKGRQFILTSQQSDGSWSSTYGTEVNTVWALLFLTRSTVQTLQKIEQKRLGAGTLLGGRGLPQDLSSLTVAGGRVVSRPMNGAVEGMLAALEDPRAANADSALAGLIARYHVGGASVLKPHKDRFRTLLGDRDPGLRQVAAWALARTGDLDAVPELITAVMDDDPNVVETARQGLQLLSRKIEGLGPPSPSTPEQRQEAARRWRAWYEQTRPLDLEGQDSEGRPPATAPASAPPASPERRP